MHVRDGNAYIHIFVHIREFNFSVSLKPGRKEMEKFPMSSDRCIGTHIHMYLCTCVYVYTKCSVAKATCVVLYTYWNKTYQVLLLYGWRLKRQTNGSAITVDG